MSDQLGSAALTVHANIDSAVATLTRLRQSTAKVFQDIEDSISKTFQVSRALRDFDVLKKSIDDLSGKIRGLESSSKGIELFPDKAKALNDLKELRAEIQKGLGTPTGTLKEQQALQSALFKQQTEDAHQAAAEKEKAFAAGLAAAKKAFAEERQLQESLFRLQTQGAHEVAQAKQAAFLVAKKALVEERELQEALFMLQTQGAHEAALAKEQAFAAAQEAAPGGLTSALEDADNQMGLFGNTMAKVEGGLKRFGLTSHDVAIILGAGLAGGAAFLIRELLQMGQAVVDSVLDLREMERQVDKTFGSRGQAKVKDFAEESARSFTLTRSEALLTANAFGLFARTLDLTEKEASTFSVLLTQVASVIQRTQPGFTTIEEAQQAIQSAISGSDDALKSLGVTAQEFADASEARFGKLPDLLTEYERALLVASLLSEQTSKDSETLGNKEVGAWTRAKEAITGFFDRIVEGRESLQFEDLIRRSVDFGGSQAELERLAKRFRDLSEEQLELLRAEVENRGPIASLIDNELDRRRGNASAISEENDALQAQIALQKLNEENFLRNTSAVHAARDAFRQFDRTLEDGLRTIARAEEDYRRTVEDFILKEKNLRIDLAREQEDIAVDLNRAEEDLQSAREDRFFRIRDAERQLADARLDSFRGIRDATERLEDFERNAARRIVDLKKREAKARKEEVRDTLTAQLALEDALAKGDAVAERSARLRLGQLQQDKRSDEAIAEAELELARELEDQEIEHARLRRDLKEERLDGLKEIKRAEEDLEQAILEGARQVRDAMRNVEDANRDLTRANEDAVRSLHELEVERSRALTDAMRAITDAERDLARALEDANRNIRRMAKSLSIAVDRLRELLELRKEERERRQTIDFFAQSGGQVFFAHGGDMRAGQPGIVGERGPELFIPNKSGTIISNEKLLKTLAQMNRGGGGGGQFVINESVDAEATARAIEARMAQRMNN